MRPSIDSSYTAHTLALSGGRQWSLPKPYRSNSGELTTARKFKSFIGHIQGVHSGRRMEAASSPADSEVTAAWQLLTDFTKRDMRPPLGQRPWLTSENRTRLKDAVLVSVFTPAVYDVMMLDIREHQSSWLVRVFGQPLSGPDMQAGGCAQYERRCGMGP